MSRNIAKSYASMTVANVTTLCLTAISYVLYSRILSPAQFAVFGTALTVARVSVTLLDGGIRNTLIADQRDFDRSQYSAIAVSLLLISLSLVAIGWLVISNLGDHLSYYSFILLYVTPFLLSYPFFFSSMVRLERNLNYERVAVVETVSVVIELALPAVMIWWAGAGLNAFVIGAFLSRFLRTLLFWAFAPPTWEGFSLYQFKTAWAMIRTSLWFQYAILANAVRDNLPILLVGPIYGPEWAGYYVWALQICAVSSQFAVAAVSRIALPVISSHATDKSRYDVSAQQIRWLSKLLGPVLVAVWLVTPVANTLLFHDRWTTAVMLLPWLLLRMMPSIASTTLSPLNFVQFGPRWLAIVSTSSTALELIAAWFALKAFGPVGLAYSYALCIWVCIALMVYKIPNRPDFKVFGLFKTVMCNNSFLLALVLGIGIFVIAPAFPVQPAVRATLIIVATATIVCLTYLVDRDIRTALIRVFTATQAKLRRK